MDRFSAIIHSAGVNEDHAFVEIEPIVPVSLNARIVRPGVNEINLTNGFTQPEEADIVLTENAIAIVDYQAPFHWIGPPYAART